MSKIDFSKRHGGRFGPVRFQPANTFEPYVRTNGRHPPWSPPHKFPRNRSRTKKKAKKKEEALPPVSLSICSVDGAVAFQDCLRIWILFLFAALSVPSKRLEIVEEISSEMTGGAVNGATVQNSLEKPFKIFIGYDPREDLAYDVCRYSILKRSSIPVEINPIKQSELRKNGLYWRERGKLESTEFSFTRFLTPHLANYDGWAMFVDCDFLYLGDIKELRGLVDDKYAVMCVQHDYTPKETTKMDGAVQTVYPRKNWSSMVLYNCGHPKNKVLTPVVVNTQTGAYLHRFQWLDDSEIGSIPFVWNFLVGHNKVVDNDPSTFPKAIHYTLGGPWFEAWKNCEFGDLWTKESEEYQKEDKSKVK